MVWREKVEHYQSISSKLFRTIVDSLPLFLSFRRFSSLCVRLELPLWLCHFRVKSTMLNDEVCTLCCIDANVQCSAIKCACIFLSLIVERCSMTNNDNSSDNNINLHHGNNDLQTIRTTTKPLAATRLSLSFSLHIYSLSHSYHYTQRLSVSVSLSITQCKYKERDSFNTIMSSSRR